MIDKSGSMFRILGAITAFALIASGAFAANIHVTTDHYAAPGWWTTVTVDVDSLEAEISAFDLTLAIDQSFYGLVKTEPGQMMVDCDWEYFNYRRIRRDSLPDFDLEGRTDLLNVTGIAAISPGYSPACYGGDNSLELISFQLLMDYDTRHANIRCQAFPIQFFWRDCEDNLLLSRYGDTVYAAAGVYDPYEGELVEAAFPGYGAPDEPCPNPPGQVLIHASALTNGWLDIPCTDSVYDPRGDLNLNGRPYEIADVVLYNCLFLWGISCFHIDVQAQLIQSDVNRDGLAVSVADMVLMIRIMLEHIMPAPKPIPSGLEAVAHLQSSAGTTRLSLDVGEDVAAVYLRAVGPPETDLRLSDISFPEREFDVGRIDDTVTMLLIDMEAGAPVLTPGRHVLFESSAPDLHLAEIVVVDRYGRTATVVREGSLLPEDAMLSQNYPNPFNATTVIQFNLPTMTDWTLTVYNALGQSMREYVGSDQGHVEIQWDGLSPSGDVAASGVYFYRLETATESQTRKMLLLK